MTLDQLTYISTRLIKVREAAVRICHFSQVFEELWKLFNLRETQF